ncbi:hypothetical protein SAMN06264849_11624 [Melghirimyces algeriensis]|uniref:Uncharacterized protein n=1 Tax=Melghirimyces algeriensis TaxID=910412 RepID=A0A521FDN1_9BACL|nr:hypothetical protein SAMN06264849_11624 [Melghirimyces algeriensis]
MKKGSRPMFGRLLFVYWASQPDHGEPYRWLKQDLIGNLIGKLMVYKVQKKA